MLKKIWLNIKIFFFYIIQGLISADKTIMSSQNTNTQPMGGIEEQKEEHNVIKDLLRGVITEEVRELRHEMYYSERKSHEFTYGGGGRAKKNSIFDYTGNIEKSDGHSVKIVQENKEIINGLSQEGIVVHGTDVNIDAKLQGGVSTTKKLDSKYTINIERDFMPRFLIERYATKLVVKDIDENNTILDIYVPIYKQQFNNISKLFQSELDRIYQGDKRSDIIEFDKLSFVTKNCYGSDDMFLYEYGNVKFDDIIKFDGSYVLRFIAQTLTNGFDMIQEFYNEKTAIKNENHEARENAAIDFNAASAMIAKDNLDVSDVQELIDKLNDGKTND